MNAPLTRDALSPDQADAYDAIVSWVADGSSPILTLGGYAGTGKTTLMSVFALDAQVSPIAFVAYTGKAASVLGRKLREAGVNTVNKLLSPKKSEDPFGTARFGGAPYCGTIHSLIYRPCPCTEPRAKGAPPIKRPCALCGEKRFALREDLDRNYKLIVIDEASMVSDEMLDDLRMFNIPMLAVGDHGQLPPVRGVGGLMKKPDIRLERIHRQAEKNPIIALSKRIRESGDFDAKLADGKAVRFGTLRDIRDEVSRRFTARGGDATGTYSHLFNQALICYTNKRRVGLNALARQARGFQGPPAAGEQVICLRNMRSLGVYNGMRGVLHDTAVCRNEEKTPWLYDATIGFPEEGIEPHLFNMCGVQFNREKTFDDVSVAREEYGVEAYSWEMLGSLFDFGYAMTCHKFQGSSAADVLVIVETYGMDPETKMRWCYTAATRASETLTVLR